MADMADTDESGGGAPAEPMPVDAAPLQYAPPARGVGRRRPLGVLAGGLFTAILAVAGVYLLARYAHEDPFRWRPLFVVPLGSLLVAPLAASGIAIASQLTHVRAGRALATAASALMALAYVAALYVQYAPFHWVNVRTRLPASFVDFVRDRSVNWVWRLGNATFHLGAFGYLHRLADVAVFAGTGALAARMGLRRPYCDLCRMYLTRRRVALFPASLPYRRLGNLSDEELAEYHAEQLEQTRAAVNGAALMQTLAEAGDVESLRQAIAGVRADRRAIAKLPTRLSLDVEACPGCRATTLRTTLLVGRSVRPLGAQAVSGEFADL
jgi:hypothetical protein